VEVGGEELHIIHGNHSLQAGQQISFSAGQQVVVEAGASVTLQAGGQWINISGDGIFCSTPIQIGGGPKTVLTSPLAGPETRWVPLSVAQIFSLKRSAPFCEECERCKEGVCNNVQRRGPLLTGGSR
jgi:type VI secretion system secreted protein VgrG